MGFLWDLIQHSQIEQQDSGQAASSPASRRSKPSSVRHAGS